MFNIGDKCRLFPAILPWDFFMVEILGDLFDRTKYPPTYHMLMNEFLQQLIFTQCVQTCYNEVQNKERWKYVKIEKCNNVGLIKLILIFWIA